MCYPENWHFPLNYATQTMGLNHDFEHENPIRNINDLFPDIRSAVSFIITNIFLNVKKIFKKKKGRCHIDEDKYDV